MVDMFAVYWCWLFHSRIMWAGGEDYECCTCHRRYAVPWASDRGKLGVYVKD